MFNLNNFSFSLMIHSKTHIDIHPDWLKQASHAKCKAKKRGQLAMLSVLFFYFMDLTLELSW